MCFEGMEESGSEGLDALIHQEADKYFKDVDCVCISDNYWLGTNKPCLTYGLRGVSYFHLSVSGRFTNLINYCRPRQRFAFWSLRRNST